MKSILLVTWWVAACVIAASTGCSTCKGLYVHVVPQDDFKQQGRAVPVAFFAAKENEVDALSKITAKQWFDGDQPGSGTSKREEWQNRLGTGPDSLRLLTLNASPLEQDTFDTIKSLPCECVKLFVWAGYNNTQLSEKPDARANIDLAPLHKGFFFFLDRTCCVDVLISATGIHLVEGDQSKRKSKT